MIQTLDSHRLLHAVRAVSSRKLGAWIAQDVSRREHVSVYFDRMATFCQVLAATGGWMTEQQVLAAWPADQEVPHAMSLDDIERILAYAEIAETDAKQGWGKYRWPKFPDEILNAVSDFRFGRSYASLSGPVPGSAHSFEVQVSDLFVPFPQQYGLRGDAYLWGSLAAYFFSLPMDVETDIETTFKDAFAQMTRHQFNQAPDEFFDERFAHGGMSSGHVSMDWWRREGLPLVRRRFDAIRDALPAPLP
jgi:molybdenum cofactor cytidylyltransferase